MSIIQKYRDKWNRRYAEGRSEAVVPEPHPLGGQWAHRFTGGPMLDAATGLGRGIATAAGRFDPVYAVDISDVAIHTARRIWKEKSCIQWILGDVGAMRWPPDYFGLVCAFGFTDLPFFARLAHAIAPGGMMLYEGFAARQIEVKPGLDPHWTSTAESMRDTFLGWEVLTCEESETPPYRLRFAAIRPTV